MNDKAFKIIGVLLYLIVFLLMIGAIINGNEKVIVVSVIVFAYITITIIAMFIASFSVDYKENKKVKEYRRFKNKDNQSVFEKLYMKAFQNKLDDELLEINTKSTFLTDITALQISGYFDNAIKIYKNINSTKPYLDISLHHINHYNETPTESLIFNNEPSVQMFLDYKKDVTVQSRN